jgi:hypothetical protein
MAKPLLADLRDALAGAAVELDAGRRNAALAAKLEALAKDGEGGGQEAASEPRRAALAGTLREIAERLRSASAT